MRFPAKIMRGEPRQDHRDRRPTFSLHTSHYPAKCVRGGRPLRKWPLVESSATG